MPAGRYDPRIKQLLEKKYGQQLPEELFVTDDSDVLAARKGLMSQQQRAQDIGALQRAASGFGQISGKRPETMFDDRMVQSMSAVPAMQLKGAEQDYGDRDKVRKYIADKYLTRPEEKVRNPWMSTGKRDEKGDLILYSKETGETKSGPRLDEKDAGDQKTQRSKEEATYRYNMLKTNAAKLKDLVSRYGTFELVGPESAKMDSIIYQMAVDFAKMVDPDSVASEGEVAAAQKYMLAFRDMGGLTTRNDTAISMIDNYMEDLKNRMQARGIQVPDDQTETPRQAPPQGAAPTPQGSAGLTPEKRKRLEELRNKYYGNAPDRGI